MSDSSREYIPGLIAGLHRGTIGRRDFMKRAAAAGLSAGLIGQVVGRYDAFAQDATPSASATSIGEPNHQHITDTSKGTIKLFSSWPLTGSYEQTRWRRRRGDQDVPRRLRQCGRRIRPHVRGARRWVGGQQRRSGPGEGDRRTSTGWWPMRTAWSTWRHTTPARPRSRSRS